MRRIKMVFIALSLLSYPASPCISPVNIEGVAFTAGETLNLQKLILFGKENVNFLKDGAEPDVGIRYISHYDPRAMIFIGNYGLSYQQNMRVNCMGVVLPLPDSANPTSKIEIPVFDFAAAVKAELVWLSANGIVDITGENIEEIFTALHASGNGGAQYWTHAKTVLGYNQWYVKDTLTGVWGSSGADVNGVRSVKGCSVIQPGSGIPPENLETPAVVRAAPSANRAIQRFTVRHSANGAAIVFFPQKTRETAFLTVTDLKGAVLFKQLIPPGVRSLYIRKPFNRRYILYKVAM